jgi:outer membrane protein OmpA-like peptidoglycan-associated protein
MLGKPTCVAVLFCSLFSFLLTGCVVNKSTTETSSIYGDSSTTRMPVKRYLAQHQAIIDSLKNQNIQVIQEGDDLMLVLSSDQIFRDQTSILNADSSSALNKVADLLKGHEKFVVQIAGYTDSLGQPLRNIALSRQQAQTIANYLWKQNIDTRLLYAVGYGQRASIANNAVASGRAMNRRIEITLRWITDPKQG